MLLNSIKGPLEVNATNLKQEPSRWLYAFPSNIHLCSYRCQALTRAVVLPNEYGDASMAMDLRVYAKKSIRMTDCGMYLGEENREHMRELKHGEQLLG